jgi:leader peptidase (prepilin peptidase)/N-methyltransferase
VSTAALGGAALLGLGAGPLLARATVRLASGDPAARPGPLRAALTALLLGALLPGVLLLTGPRPAAAAYGWAAGAAVVLAGVDLAAHRLPDRVTAPTAAGAALALLVDAAALGSWPALVRAVLAAAVTAAVALPAALPASGIGLGDVKLLALLGLLLGWAGWGVLLAGVFLGLLAGAAGSVLLVLAGRAGWRTAVPFGPPLLAGAVLALAIAGPVLGS